jgi:hypothetical protein
MARRAGCRRSRHPRCPGPGLVSPGLLAALRERRGSRARRGLRPPRRTSGDQEADRGARGPARLVPRPPARPGQARRAQAVKAPVRARRVPPDRAGRAARAARAVRAARVVRADPARPVLGPRVPGARVLVLRVPGRGPVTTRSVRPRPAWARRPLPGPRVPLPAPRAVPAQGRATARAPAVQAARVPAGEARAARAGPAGTVDRAARVPAGSRVRVPAAPGRAR